MFLLDEGAFGLKETLYSAVLYIDTSAFTSRDNMEVESVWSKIFSPDRLTALTISLLVRYIISSPPLPPFTHQVPLRSAAQAPLDW